MRPSARYRNRTDEQTRLVEDAVDNLRRTLEWAGLDYDEGELKVTLSGCWSEKLRS